MQTRTTRDGEKLTVGTAEELGVDARDGKWVTICESHSALANSATKRLALATAGKDFCDGCRSAAEEPARLYFDAKENEWARTDGKRVCQDHGNLEPCPHHRKKK
jgi:hypothetical protein